MPFFTIFTRPKTSHCWWWYILFCDRWPTFYNDNDDYCPDGSFDCASGNCISLHSETSTENSTTKYDLNVLLSKWSILILCSWIRYRVLRQALNNDIHVLRVCISTWTHILMRYLCGTHVWVFRYPDISPPRWTVIQHLDYDGLWTARPRKIRPRTISPFIV